MPSYRAFARAGIGLSAATALSALVATSSPHAQGKRAMTPVDLINIPRVLDPQMTRDGRRIIFTMLTSDWASNRRIGQIWQIGSDGSDLRRLTNIASGAVNARWAPDGARFALLARGESGDQSIFLASADGGAPRQLSYHATGLGDITWSPDGTAIYFLAGEPRAEAERARERVRDDVFAFDENFKQQHLWRIALADGAEQRVTGGDFSILSYTIAPNGKHLVVDRAPTPLVADGEQSEIWIMDADGKGARQLTHNEIAETDSELSPDGSRVLFVAGANDRLETYYNDNVFVMPATGGNPRMVAPDFPYQVLRAGWANDGRSIWMVVNMGVHSELFELDLTSGRPRQMTDGTHSIVQWSLVSGERHVFQFDEPTRFGDVWTFGPNRAAPPVRVTGIYDYLDRDFQLPRQERIEWKGADGTRIEGLLAYPLDYKPGTRYPLSVQTHGGPSESDRYSFGPFIWQSYQQVLAAKGYAVLKPNYRGSTGYGNAFLRGLIGGYFKNAHLDVLAGVDRVIALGVADPDKLVAMGWSAGGHMTNKLITFTNRFKAASSGAGAADWVSMYGQTDVRAGREFWFGGTPWQKNAQIEAYWEDSPLKYVSSARTPTLFFVGQNDPAVPMPQSVEMYRALRATGVQTHLYVAPREGHAWAELQHQLFKMNAELEWFEKYAANRPYAWQPAPASNDTSMLPSP